MNIVFIRFANTIDSRHCQHSPREFATGIVNTVFSGNYNHNRQQALQTQLAAGSVNTITTVDFQLTKHATGAVSIVSSRNW
jgi:hypothetical protein